MTKVEQTKHRLLRELVRDNILLVRGIRPKSFYRPRRLLSGWLLKSVVIVSPVLLLVWLYVAPTSTGYWQQEMLPSQAVGTMKSPEHPYSAASRTTSPEVPFPRPQPLGRAVLPLGVRKIVLDPGHGGEELGAVASSGLMEKEVTLDIGLRLRRSMEEASYEVLLTRQKDEGLPLAARAGFANENGADIFVSIHVNWTKASRLRSLETYFLGPTKDPLSLELASVENRDSSYSWADFRRLLEKIYTDTRREESRKLAETMQRELFMSLSRFNPQLQNRGVKMAPFAVLVGAEMPAILVEISCLSNEDEVRLLASADYRQKIAEGLFAGIRAYAETLNGSYSKGVAR